MAGDKKSFILYCDLIHTVKKMSKSKAGELFKTILEYVNDNNPEVTDTIIELVFEPIRQQLKRDLVKYEYKKEQWSKAGKASVEARKKKPTNVNKRSKRSTDLTVSDNDSVNVNGIKNKGVSFSLFWDLYNKKIGSKSKCEKKWYNLDDKIRVGIIYILPDWLTQFKDKQYQPYPETFLNNERWNDEIKFNDKIEVDSKGNTKPSKQHTLVSKNGVKSWMVL